MKIIVNALSARRGGIATYTKNLARSFKRRGVDSIFAISNEFELDDDVTVIRSSANRMTPIKRLLWEQIFWRRLIAKHNPDVLFSSANFGLFFSNVPQVLLVREGGLFDPVYLANIGPSASISKLAQRIIRRRLILTSARASNIIVTPSDTTKKLLVSVDKDLERRIIVNQYGTLSNLFTQPQKYYQFKKGRTLKLLYVSVYYPHKIPSIISEAVKKLNERGIKTHLTITMNLDQIEQTPGGEKDFILLKKGLERNQITLIGDVPYENLPLIYSQHDLFVFPSISETFGHPLVEAMSMGLPIIASDTSIHREICQDAAIYYSPFLISDLVQKVEELYNNEVQWNILSKNGKKNSKNYFSWEEHVNRLVSIFEKVTD
jgi:glycosyltransferase involved in cell wall biosynthesis